MRAEAQAALLAALAVAGCNSILGIEEAQPMSDAALGGSGGAVGGGAGQGGAFGGQAGVDAASGGSAGQAGGGGDASDGSSCTDVQNDAKNCGWCGHDCQTTACVQGLCAPIEVTALEPGAQTMRVVGDSVFVAGGWSWKLEKIPKLGGASQSWTGTDEVLELAVHGGFVYFTEYNPKKIYRTPTTGAPAPTVVLTSSSILNSIGVDDTGIYYAENGTSVIRRAKLDGTGSIDFVTNAYSAWHIAFDATHVYFSRVNDGIYRVPKSGTPPHDESTLQYFHDILGDGPPAMLLDGDWVYFSTGDPSYTFPITISQIMRKSKLSGQLETVGTSKTLVFGIAVADGYAYWAEEGTLQKDFTDGAVRRVKLSSPGAQPETLAQGQNHPVAVAVDGPWVYWLNGGWTGINGAVMRVAR